MIIEKIKDKALRERMTGLIEAGRSFTSEMFKTDPSILEHLPFKDDYAVWLPRTRMIRINQEAERPVDTILPSLVLDHFIQKAAHRVIINFCPCRESKGCKDFPVEYGCIYLGEAAKAIHPELGRAAGVEETLEYARRCREAGLVHHVGYVQKDSVWLDVGPSNKLMTVCNCCPCCCSAIPDTGWPPEMLSLHRIVRLPGLKVQVTDRCVGCETCLDVCKFKAIKMEDDKALITDACAGCGRCVEACPEEAIEITVESMDALEKTIEKISGKVDCT